MPGPCGRQPVDALNQRGKARNVRARCTPEGLPEAQVPCQVQGRAGQTGDRSCYIASQPGRDPAHDHRHQDRLKGRDYEDLHRDQEKRHGKVDERRTGPCPESENCREENTADQDVRGHGGHEPGHEDVACPNRGHDQLEQVTPHEQRRDHRRKANEQHEQ